MALAGDTLGLAALLHDIGKLWQRADPGQERVPHGELGAAFVDRFVPSPWRDQVVEAVRAHHDPSDQERAHLLVALGDWLSAAERERDESPGVRPRQAISVLSQVHLEGALPQGHYHPLLPLDTSAPVFQPSREALPDPSGAYAALWQGFLAEHQDVVRGVPGMSARSYLTTLLALLQKYTWCVPSSYWRDVPDIPLFNHLQTACAFACALERSGASLAEARAMHSVGPGDAPRARSWSDKERFTLLAGDLSGVQRFLFTLTSFGVARGLKGRSFYLQMVTDAVVRWLLRRLDLPWANVLSAAGGHFLILAPRLEDEALHQYQQELAQRFARLYRGDLHMALGAYHVTPAELLERGFAACVEAAFRSAAQEKQRRLAALPAEELAELFQPPDSAGAPEAACVICRREPAPHPHPDAPGRRTCDLCGSLAELGLQLRDAEYLLVEPVEDGAEGEGAGAGPAPWHAALRSLGYSYRLLREEDLPQRPPRDGAHLLFLRGTDVGRPAALRWARHADVALGFRPLAHATPRAQDAEGREVVVDFATLAERSQGIRRLGILRMDVDNLGLAFRRGLDRPGGQRGGSPSRLGSLSFLLQWFFEGRVSAICDREPYRDAVYLIYSGGDDLFVVGAWNVLPDLARDIQQAFTRFTGENPSLHLSAGLILVPSTYPLYQGAEAAGEALEEAKARPGKSAICLLGTTVPWARFATVERWRHDLEALVGGTDGRRPAAPRALLHLLQRLHHLTPAAHPGTGRTPRAEEWAPLGRWTWLAAYHLTRLAERVEDTNVALQLKELRNALLQERYLTEVALAARWVELLLRTEEHPTAVEQ